MKRKEKKKGLYLRYDFILQSTLDKCKTLIEGSPHKLTRVRPQIRNLGRGIFYQFKKATTKCRKKNKTGSECRNLLLYSILRKKGLKILFKSKKKTNLKQKKEKRVRGSLHFADLCFKYIVDLRKIYLPYR